MLSHPVGSFGAAAAAAAASFRQLRPLFNLLNCACSHRDKAREGEGGGVDCCVTGKVFIMKMKV